MFVAFMARSPFGKAETGCFCDYAITIAQPSNGDIGNSAYLQSHQKHAGWFSFDVAMM
jgi:hypothetical protein